MTNPLVPNFKTGVGELATRRSDFQKHIEGVDSKHNANTINVIPNLVVGLTTSTNVLDALEALRDATLAPVDATTSNKGIIQISGDITGIATNIIVTGIQGKPISTLTPSNNDVLTWNGAAWTPAASNSFNASGDLSGAITSKP